MKALVSYVMVGALSIALSAATVEILAQGAPVAATPTTPTLEALYADAVAKEAWRRANNVQPYRVASRLLRSFYRQLFEDNLFHGDLHPGNIVQALDALYDLLKEELEPAQA